MTSRSRAVARGMIARKAGKIGTLVCWDQWFPEAARLTALGGAQFLFYPTAIGWLPAEKSQYGAAQQNAWETMQRSHAIANGVFVVAVNRVGHEGRGESVWLGFFIYRVLADFVPICEGRGEREHDSGYRERAPEHDAERDAAEVFKVEHNSKNDVVELDAGEDNGEQKHRDSETTRRANEISDQLFGAVYQQHRPGDED